MEHLHLLGISGTFMSALALLARDAGYKVTGSDAHCYPPISDLLHAKGIEWTEGYEDSSQALAADWVIVGNAMKRGIPVVEAVLDAGKKYTSGPQWLAENILSRYRVLAVAGTHGKTTTTTMLATILHYAGLEPGFLIGGVAPAFNTSACLGKGDFFVIEADEYDSAFFDKRPKLMHYRPEVAIINNLEFDHADIYADIEAIQQQFHYFLKTIPPKGTLIKPKTDRYLNAVIEKGLFSNMEEISLKQDADWRAEIMNDAASVFCVYHQGKRVAEVTWDLIGSFNVENALAAIAAAARVGVEPKVAAEALQTFVPVKRRLEVRGNSNGVTVYDDFAHHPTAISRTIEALKASKRHQRILLVLEFASFTMKTGVHGNLMASAVQQADAAFILQPQQFDLSNMTANWTCKHQAYPDVQRLIEDVSAQARQGDAILVMSNRGFDNIHSRLLQALQERALQTV